MITKKTFLYLCFLPVMFGSLVVRGMEKRISTSTDLGGAEYLPPVPSKISINKNELECIYSEEKNDTNNTTSKQSQASLLVGKNKTYTQSNSTTHTSNDTYDVFEEKEKSYGRLYQKVVELKNTVIIDLKMQNAKIDTKNKTITSQFENLLQEIETLKSDIKANKDLINNVINTVEWSVIVALSNNVDKLAIAINKLVSLVENLNHERDQTQQILKFKTIKNERDSMAYSHSHAWINPTNSLLFLIAILLIYNSLEQRAIRAQLNIPSPLPVFRLPSIPFWRSSR